MTSVEKSPNMMSTTGRNPVIAAPTAMPVKPASEIGVSSTRSLPNSSTSPLNTLNTVPASAMSSPQMNTRGSRRSSSASASRTASPNVNSRISGIDILIYFVDGGIRRCHREGNRFVDLGFHLHVHLLQLGDVGEALTHQPMAQHL